MGNLTSQSVQEDGTGHPAGWWPLNQSSGTTVTDASGTGNTATATGVTWSNSAASFSATAGQKIATNGPVLGTSGAYSVSAWVNMSTVPASNVAVAAQTGTQNSAFVLASHYNGTKAVWGFWHETTDNSTPSFVYADSTITPVASTWTHLVAVYNPSTGAMQLYVNGTLAASATDTAPWAASGAFTIGSDLWKGSTTDLLNGQADNVQAYPRALSQAEITSLYNSGRNGGTTAATTSWTLDKRGLPTQITDADTNATSYTYDEAGRLVQTVAPAVNVETNGGSPTLQHPTTTVGYDTFGEQVENQGPDGSNTTVTTTYDADGRKASTILPSYTPPGGTAITNATTNYVYDGNNQVTKVTDPLTHATNYVYDQLGDTAQVTDANNGVSHTLYDTNGQATSSTDPAGVQTQATYDWMGRPLTSTILERYRPPRRRPGPTRTRRQPPTPTARSWPPPAARTTSPPATPTTTSARPPRSPTRQATPPTTRTTFRAAPPLPSCRTEPGAPSATTSSATR
jgi:YD repeat-containing protein